MVACSCGRNPEHVAYGTQSLVRGARNMVSKFSEMDTIEQGLRFKTVSGIVVETTGQTQLVESEHQLYVHEVVIVEGVGEGNKYLHNLDSAEPL